VTVESILDKLVTGSSSEGPSEPPPTEPVVPVETSAPKPNEEMLRKLSEPKEGPEPKPVVQEKKIETKPVEPRAGQEEPADRSILDQLTGGSTSQDEDEGQTKKSQAGD
jgi:hypothetical protein